MVFGACYFVFSQVWKTWYFTLKVVYKCRDGIISVTCFRCWTLLLFYSFPMLVSEAFQDLHHSLEDAISFSSGNLSYSSLSLSTPKVSVCELLALQNFHITTLSQWYVVTHPNTRSLLILEVSRCEMIFIAVFVMLVFVTLKKVDIYFWSTLTFAFCFCFDWFQFSFVCFQSMVFVSFSSG